ncbi:MAG: response regulator [Candidatus Tectomicrobia bacterium]|uniref:Response regulator n=1 Tax=Tectimicrobiota bacterium TaxID=2528274 RepID=A0A937VZF9_UNCTE|nr:response regulator [Candidatus Tectomicrobia bacterium]
MDASKHMILLVDDDPALLRLLSIRLTAAGYEVITADSGAQALTLTAMHYPQLVITDLQMGEMDGMVLFDSLHRSHPTLPVIILTAHGSIPEAVAATQRGVFGFLTKPFDGKDLLVQVEKALRLSGSTPEPGKSTRDDDWRKAILTRSPLMEDVLRQVRLVAESDASVLIYGESGTGKELIAQAIHLASRRRGQAFVPVNCGAIPETLLESELFGYAKGAFTGATQDHVGLFQAAHQGTLFLDEIGDMPLALQVKLLRVLQEKQVRPVGTTKTVAIDVRIVSATHRSLESEMQKGNFREDLYYRLKVVALTLPNLAARREDIPLLATHFLERCAAKSQKHVTGFAPDALEMLVQAPWPGNVRHLLNVVEQTVILSTTPIIPASLVRQALSNTPGTLPPLDDAKHLFEQEYLVRLLKITHGNVSQAARLAGRNRTEFYRLLERHQLDPVQFRAAEV